jgi:hypothetical protein
MNNNRFADCVVGNFSSEYKGDKRHQASCDIVSSESCPDSLAKMYPALEKDLQQALNGQNLKTNWDMIHRVFGAEKLTQLRDFDQLKLDKRFDNTGMTPNHRRRPMKFSSTSTNASNPADPVKKKFLILEALKYESLTESEILHRFGFSRHNKQLVRHLLREKLINRFGKGGKNDAYRYSAV